MNASHESLRYDYEVSCEEIDILVFGPEFIGRVEEIADEISKGLLLYFIVWTRMREYITSKRCPQKRKRIIPLMRIE